MDAFLPGIGNWKDVWLMRDLWHFHFYGTVPLALVKGRERIYFEHFWNDFAADPNTRSQRPTAASMQRLMHSREECAPASSTSATSSKTRRTSRSSGDKASPNAGAGSDRREGQRHLPHRAGKTGCFRCKGVVVPGSGHWLMEEAPNAVIPAIIDFLH